MTALRDGCGSSSAPAATGVGGQAGWDGELFVKCCGGPTGGDDDGTAGVTPMGSDGVGNAAAGGCDGGGSGGDGNGVATLRGGRTGDGSAAGGSGTTAKLGCGGATIDGGGGIGS